MCLIAPVKVSFSCYAIVSVGVLLIAWRYFRKRARLASISNIQPSVSRPPTIHKPSRNPSQCDSKPPPHQDTPSPPAAAAFPHFKNTNVGNITSNLSTLLSQYRITVVETTAECEECLGFILSNRPTIVGLDCEWTNVQKRSQVSIQANRRGGVDVCEGRDAGVDGENCDGGDAGEGGDTDRQCHSFPVALLQLAFTSGECLLIRLCKMRKMGPQLEELLRDKGYVNVDQTVA